jgi:hypothetical protein
LKVVVRFKMGNTCSCSGEQEEGEMKMGEVRDKKTKSPGQKQQSAPAQYDEQRVFRADEKANIVKIQSLVRGN